MSIRLIDTTTLRMKLFVGEDIPQYAILSHTWIEDEEVDFREMTALVDNHKHFARWKSGYLKIWFTCEQARRHELPYAWIDTCCIDKSSSAELSQAINSMFKWYRDAKVCFAFLSDLHLPSGSCNDRAMRAMRDCRWFRRGWTLQELIAPPSLRFYNSAWEFVESKSQLKSLFRSITGVDEDVLSDRACLPEIPLARRMSWPPSVRPHESKTWLIVFWGSST